MFESDAAWETALDSLDADIESLAAFAGKLTDAVTIGAYLDASTEVGPQGRASLLLRLPAP